MPTDRAIASGARVVSGDAVALDIRLARVGSRMLARLIDLAVQAALYGALLILGLIFLYVVGDPSTALLHAMFIIGLIVVFVGYPTVIESITGGRTPGKMALGLRVIRDDGGPVRFRHALTRALVSVAVEFPGLVMPPLTWGACLWTMLGNAQGKRLGDMAAGTMVIHDRSPATWGWVPAMPVPLAGWATTLDLTGLPDELALSVRHFLARNRELREPARSRLGYSLASEVAAIITPPAPPGTPGWAYLAAVLAERNRRSAARLARARQLTARVFPEAVSHLASAHEDPPYPEVQLDMPKKNALRPAIPETVRH